MKKKVIIIITSIVLVIGLVVGGLYYFKNLKGNENFSYILLQINPKLLLSLDKNNKVIDVEPLNDDAEIFKSEDLIGLDLENAIDKVIDVALDNGYLEDGLIDMIGMSNFEGFSLEQAEKFVKNKGITIKNGTDDLLDFGIDCDYFMHPDTDINNLTKTQEAELMVCNAYAVTAWERSEAEAKKLREYSDCMTRVLQTGGTVEECGEHPSR